MTYITMQEAFEQSAGLTLHRTTYHRIAKPSKTKPYVRTVKVSGRRLTTIKWVEDYIRQCTEASALAQADSKPVRSAAQRQRNADRADKELTKLGV